MDAEVEVKSDDFHVVACTTLDEKECISEEEWKEAVNQDKVLQELIGRLSRGWPKSELVRTAMAPRPDDLPPEVLESSLSELGIGWAFGTLKRPDIFLLQIPLSQNVRLI
ncbi:hypothetical protein NDU88_004803 [Pleurodeles waltl]|uniref:Uncharacterized protein n=1 Tax=Pleurodeles waltl TaxID=8319 RepID=A0AAV7TA62_PLEWA|nr:hypothetical protein NDU88_004803 [Pleurodeles waltl]